MPKTAELPIFRRYNIEEIARRTGYSERYLLGVKVGSFEANTRFRRLVSQFMNESEAELFGPHVEE